mgnify:CR=1 FL=1
MALSPQLPQVMRFLSVGGLGVLLYYPILYILTDLVGVWYIISAVIASVLDYGSIFILQKVWTFKNKNTEGMYGQAFKYSIMLASFFTANLILLYVLVEYGHLWYLAAQVVIAIPLSVVSYLLSRRIFSS